MPSRQLIARLFVLMLCAWTQGATPVAATPIGTAQVDVRIARDRAHAVVKLDRPVRAFDFEPGDVVRDGVFEIITPGLTFQAERVTGTAPFRRFELRMRPATREYDAKYPSFYSIGDGGLIFMPALKGKESAWRTRYTIRIQPGQVRAPASGSITGGYVYVGPAALVSKSPDLVVVADPGTPRWLVDRSQAELATAVRLFTKTMGMKLPRTPVLIVKNIEDGTGFVGDVTPGSVTALRFHGAASGLPTSEINRIQGFVLHEAFHFWNGGVARVAKGTPSWLHEGGADYAALMAGQMAGTLSDADVNQRLADALTNCKSGLESEGNKSLAALPFLSNRVRYPCGMVLQWAIDLRVRQASSNRQNILDIWGKVIRAAQQRQATYSLPDFYAAAGIDDPANFVPLALIVDQGGAERWEALVTALGAFGADVGTIATPDTRRPALLFHLLAQNCKAVPKGAGYGFYLNDGILKLQSLASCGVLADDPVITAIEGANPVSLSAETYAAVQAKCGSGAGVHLTTADSRTLIAACTAPLKPAPKGYVVKAWKKSPPV